MKKLALALACSFAFFAPHAQGKEIESVHRYHVGDRCVVIVTSYYPSTGGSYTRNYSCEFWDRRNNRDAENERAAEVNKKFDALDQIFKTYPVVEDIRNINEFDGGETRFFPDIVAKSLDKISSQVVTFGEFARLIKTITEAFKGSPDADDFSSVFNIRQAFMSVGLRNNEYKIIDSWRYKKIKTHCEQEVWAFYNILVGNDGDTDHFGFLLRINKPKDITNTWYSFAPMKVIESGFSDVCGKNPKPPKESKGKVIYGGDVAKAKKLHPEFLKRFYIKNQDPDLKDCEIRNIRVADNFVWYKWVLTLHSNKEEYFGDSIFIFKSNSWQEIISGSSYYPITINDAVSKGVPQKIAETLIPEITP